MGRRKSVVEETVKRVELKLDKPVLRRNSSIQSFDYGVLGDDHLP